MKTFSIGDEYFSLTLNERRERFLNLSPAFSVLEQRVLAHGGNRLIYMPEMIHVEGLALRGSLAQSQFECLEASGELAGRCHGASIAFWKMTSGEARVWTGFALSNNSWKPHSWVYLETFLEVTPFERDAYFGFELTDEESEAFSKHHFDEA